jgi:hypothetical protein
MGRTAHCEYCGAELDPAQELRFLFEIQHRDDPERLAALGELPRAGGEPMLVCKECHTSVSANDAALREEGLADDIRVRRNGRLFLTLLGSLAVWFVFAAVAALFR